MGVRVCSNFYSGGGEFAVFGRTLYFINVVCENAPEVG